MSKEKRREVAEWYIINVFSDVKDKEAEVEWLVRHLKTKAFKLFEADYDEQMNNLEADGFFK